MIYRSLPAIVGLLVAAVGATVLALLEWPAFTVYLVGFAGILAYTATLAYVEGHPRDGVHRR